jgi:hypothetical protein
MPTASPTIPTGVFRTIRYFGMRRSDYGKRSVIFTVEPDASNFMVKILRIYMGVNTETGAVSELNEPLSIK